MKKPFQLFVGEFPCVIEFADKSRMEHGDYKTVARVIKDTGEIKFFVSPDKIPGDVLLRIEHTAHAIQANLERR